MPTLRITVINAPKEFPGGGFTDLQLVSQGKKGRIRATGEPMVFEVPFELREDGRPKGEFIYVYGDKRPFVYLQWWGVNASGFPETFRRIKLYWDQLPEPDATGDIAARVSGVDKKGHPACSTALVV